ncbi:MAG: lipopolysaccharide O-side chain biosynthesis protein [Candidatus Peregrinibacteria bacterium GW2011_GWA2_44_7]|nr:MAG: lipopolysaccharide O-side chain biosynthesis protein [Candidatus Peregrinibacteria bacterium GW2011_GWA2_44_7]
MGAARRIYKNTLYLGVAEIVSKVLQFVIMLYAARILDKEYFGRFSFALSLSLIAIVLADLGINTLLVREISRNRNLASKYFFNAFSIKVLLSFVTYFIIMVILNILDYPNDTRRIVYIIWLFTILSTFTELFYSIFRAFEMMIYDAFLKILRMIMLTFASLYVLFKGYGVFVFSYMFAFVEIIIVLVALVIALKSFIKLKVVLDYSFAKAILKKALPFGFAFVFGSIYFFIGSVMLSKIKGDAEVAVYSVAYNLILAILFIPTVYTNAIYPVLSRYYKESKSGLRVLYEKSFKYLYIIGLPISIGLYLLAGRIIFFFYGEIYADSIIALQIISWYLFIKFINFLFGTVLSSINREVFLFVIYYWYVSKNLYFYNFLVILIKPIMGVIVMAFFIKFLNFGLILTILFSALVYSISLFTLKAFDKEDYKIIKKLFENEKLPKDI